MSENKCYSYSYYLREKIFMAKYLLIHLDNLAYEFLNTYTFHSEKKYKYIFFKSKSKQIYLHFHLQTKSQKFVGV